MNALVHHIRKMQVALLIAKFLSPSMLGKMKVLAASTDILISATNLSKQRVKIKTFDDPSCLDMLLSLYTYVYRTEDIMHISSNSIIVSIGNIAQQSLELLEKVADGVKAISEKLRMPILLEQIDKFNTLYYQRMDVRPSFKEALEDVNKIIK